ncbi:MAG: Zn-ribbon domain-containing OB-fold protein [Candidatus Hadarchaeota archaeon]
MEKFLGFKCKSCGRVMYPKHDRCLKCKATEFEEVELGKEAKLVTYTKLYAVPEGIEMPPLVLGVVEFPGGARALGQIASDNPMVGMKLRPVWGKLRMMKGKEIFGFKFEPA